ncbi:uncharacterized protein PGTG_21472 [Puccinia graminis f. sp. tritici CRL 75-36-700-3]|uniref:Uncharacterized protein n=1 Tax=Puccinia graminis f. sp. tritici (strain CRL 75-36-700-3 / race SCCL) TaxID=418459 RepID=H6QRV4_PUCGT|nr:uncharacterized protein PGTG_21472 [Puccinia graminis f. sp. tritici CRL 75-36-700-3]EHS63396.1 hypothetical protein PGTG_21472 [Puccinia graminis f. sp. tritici CRL 75-36-700-3]
MLIADQGFRLKVPIGTANALQQTPSAHLKGEVPMEEGCNSSISGEGVRRYQNAEEGRNWLPIRTF